MADMCDDCDLTRDLARERDANIEVYGAQFRSVSYYLGDAIDNLNDIFRGFTEYVSVEEIDTLVGTGLSGALIVPPLAREYDLHWAIVRKPNDGSHTTNEIEGHIGESWLFVDDLIDSGETLRRTVESVNRNLSLMECKSEFVGALTYNAYLKFVPAEAAPAWWGI